MNRFVTTRGIALCIFVWLIVLGCRTGDLIAQSNPPSASTAVLTRGAATVRPTFTPAPPPTDIPPPAVVNKPSPTPPRIVPTRSPTSRPAPPRPTAIVYTPTPAPPPPTVDPYAGYYYKPRNVKCVTADNTRIEGTVTENGIPKNGVKVRVSDREGGGPSIDDFITGVDPTDFKHTCPTCAGKYRLALYEGQRNAGNWWVFVIDDAGNLLSPGVLVTTQDGGGCNTATVDFIH